MQIVIWKSICLNCFEPFYELDQEERQRCPFCHGLFKTRDDVIRNNERNVIEIGVEAKFGTVVELRSEVVQKRIAKQTSTDVSGKSYGDPWDVMEEPGRELH